MLNQIRLFALILTGLVCLLGSDYASAMYDPGTGRFLQRDPSGYPDGMNSYGAYHVMRGGVDPSGLSGRIHDTHRRLEDQRERRHKQEYRRRSVPTMPTTGDEPDYQPDLWNDEDDFGDRSRQSTNNCYSYACDDHDPARNPNSKPQPGSSSGESLYEIDTEKRTVRVTCASVTKAAIADGLTPVNCDNCCPEGTYKVALVVSPGDEDGLNNDYHWYRQNSDGLWDHKPGHGPATNLDRDGLPINDPREANRDYRWKSWIFGPKQGVNYSEFCGCFCATASQ